MEQQEILKENIDSEQLSDALSSRYLSYAISTIVSRALPDVRDGCKPVHRRILYSMLRNKLTPNATFRKCAKVVGDVLGSFHPHGDSSVYDALVRLAQDFSVRYPLINGQGNFGNIDGDPQAAYRYTESKMTEAALLLTDGLDESSVDMMPNFDGTTTEPIVLPGAFPNLLANGGMGIAVGMATNIPTHNVAEIMSALNLLIDKPDSKTKDIVKKILAPDFPTGGVIVDDEDTIIKNYETGKGAFRIRCKWKVETVANQKVIVITEIPYGVIKQKLVEQIADLIDNKKLPLIDDISDESTTDIRIVITPKSRNVPIDTIMSHLFAITDCEVRFNMNLNVIDSSGSPRVMGLVEILKEFINHQRNVLIRRSKFKLSNINNRLEVLAGLLIVYLNLDRVIEIIRTFDDPKEKLKEEFNLTEIQAEFILNTKLRSLRKLEEMEIKKEDKELKDKKKELEELLESDYLQSEKLKSIFNEIKNKYGKNTPLGIRKTLIEPAEIAVVNTDDFIEKEPITIILSNLGWIRSAKGHLDLASLDFKFKEGDSLKFALHSNTADKLNLFTSSGKMFSLACDNLPSARGFGESVRMMADISGDEDIISAFVLNKDKKYLVVSKHGSGFIVLGNNCLAQTKSGRQVMTGDDESVLCKEVDGKYLAISGSNDKILIIETQGIPEMSKGKGVILQKYNASKTYVLDCTFFDEESGFSWKTGRGITKFSDWKLWLAKRATQGKTIPFGFPKSGKFSN